MVRAACPCGLVAVAFLSGKCTGGSPMSLGNIDYLNLTLSSILTLELVDDKAISLNLVPSSPASCRASILAPCGTDHVAYRCRCWR